MQPRRVRHRAGMVLRRLSGRTDNTPPVLTLITQFGGGKTHTLTGLYHLVGNGEKAGDYTGVSDLLKEPRLSSVPRARVAVFVGNAWDPPDGRETPWIDIARQLAGDKGVEALGKAAKTTPPGTESIAHTTISTQASTAAPPNPGSCGTLLIAEGFSISTEDSYSAKVLPMYPV